MKKTLIAAAALFAISGTAHADSTVTLYGLLDASVNYTSNIAGNSRLHMDSGTMQGSRWGLRISEDLGGGLKAIGVLESGFNIGTGHSTQNGKLFGRQAYVGLSSNSLGTVTFGRQYLVSSDFVSPLTMTAWSGSMGPHPFDLDNLDNSHRANHTIKYLSANYSGFQFGGSVSPGGVAGRMGADLVWSVGAGYNNGPFAAGVSYTSSRNPSISPVAKYANLYFDFAMTEDLVRASSTRYNVAAAGINYTFGAATVGAAISHSTFKLESLGGLEFMPAPKTTTLSAELHARYQLSPALQVGAGYSYTQIKTPSGWELIFPKSHYHQVTVGSSYALSKRTDVYALAGVQTAKGTPASIGDATNLSSGKSQFKASAGIRHRF